MERVLLNRKRNANPFFHLYESLWMLAGRNEVEWLNTYIGTFGQRFAEPDGRVHGAYGHRWRRAFGFDQLEVIVERLKKNPQDRQCVLQMWDCRDTKCDDLMGDWKDRPCNTHIYFRVREVIAVEGLVGSYTSKTGMWPVLEMTVCCRSNDIVYGAYGANAVHFSVLMEYVAGRIGADVGTMYQVSNNYHGYDETMPAVSDADDGVKHYETIKPLPMANDWEKWDEDLETFLTWEQHLVKTGQNMKQMNFTNSWFENTARPMFYAHFLWKHAMKTTAKSMVKTIAAEDWRLACIQWMEARS
jgi:thymidylate synthase